MPEVRIDFSEASDYNFNQRNVEEGDYLFVIKDSTVGKSKAGNEQAVLTLTSPQIAGGIYPLYLPLTGKGSGKMRQVMAACGFDTAGKSAVKFNTDKLHGKQVGGTLLDDEYNGNVQSKIDSVFHKGKLDSSTAPVEDLAAAEPDPTDEDIDTLPAKPAARKTVAKKAAPAKAAEPEEFVDLEEI